LSTFTDKFRQAQVYAEQEAQRHQHAAIGTEHLLLGILGVGSSVAVAALAKLQVTPEMVRAALQTRMQTQTGQTGSQQMTGSAGWTPDARKAIGAATEEALQLAARGPEYLGAYARPYVGTEHLLLGILQVAVLNEWAGAPCVAGAALAACDVSYNRAYNAVCQCLRDIASRQH
jgi:ATP-dependent Clp protease ATP-binding subunit ClpC